MEFIKVIGMRIMVIAIMKTPTLNPMVTEIFLSQTLVPYGHVVMVEQLLTATLINYFSKQ